MSCEDVHQYLDLPHACPQVSAPACPGPWKHCYLSTSRARHLCQHVQLQLQPPQERRIHFEMIRLALVRPGGVYGSLHVYSCLVLLMSATSYS